MRSPGSWYAVSHAVTSRRLRARGHLRLILMLALVALVTAAGCSTSPDSGGAATDTMTTSPAGRSVPEPTVATTPTNEPTRSAPGTPEMVLSWIEESPDSVDTATRTYQATAPDADSPVHLTLPLQVPPGSAATVKSDRVLVRDADGRFVVAAELLINDVPSPTGDRRPALADTDSGPVLVLEPGGPVTVKVRVCRQLVLQTTWLKRSGTRSLRVTPTWVSRPGSSSRTDPPSGMPRRCSQRATRVMSPTAASRASCVAVPCVYTCPCANVHSCAASQPWSALSCETTAQSSAFSRIGPAEWPATAPAPEPVPRPPRARGRSVRRVARGRVLGAGGAR